MYLPPASQQGPFSHCQRPFGLKTTTRSCHTTSHPVGHSIQRLIRNVLYKYSMELQNCIDVVEKLLRQNKRNYKDSHEQLLYERGYLTGLLARMMSDDPSILHQIINKTNRS